ncbi:MAG: winged helix-turn-helix domain-containing protein, partial [Myxococcales bacterium]|nr:winged helix-turn-helix domain-containing protein [Myxococcales bacterium]
MPSLPAFHEYMVPIVSVLRREGRPLPIQELDDLVVKEMGLTEEQLSVPHSETRPDQSEASYHMTWARSYLKKTGWLENPKRGLWEASGDASLDQLDPEAVKQAVHDTYSRGKEKAQDLLELELEEEEHSNARVGIKVARTVKEAFDEAKRAGQIPSRVLVDQQRSRFRERFGPDALSKLDGEALLLHMHARGNHDSLVYWLEFKDDEEFGGWFGSITGGSALKFGLYQSAETQEWATGTPQKQVPLALEGAIAIARRQRDQLIAAHGVLSTAESDPNPDFEQIQADIERLAPDVGETIWGHKYLSLLHPTLVSAFHAIAYQRYELTKLVKHSSEKRYENARYFFHIARQLGMTMFELSITLRKLFGAPRSCWRVGTLGDEGSFWPQMRDGSYMAVNWPLPSFGWLDDNPNSR